MSDRRTAGAAQRRKPGPRPTRARTHGSVSRRTGRPADARRRPDADRRVRVNRERPKAGVGERRESRAILRTLTTVAARALLGLVILAVFVFGVFPTGSYLDQRDQLHDAERQLVDLQNENRDLQLRVDRLESDVEIERVARKEFDMVLPQEESYLVLPPGN